MGAGAGGDTAATNADFAAAAKRAAEAVAARINAQFAAAAPPPPPPPRATPLLLSAADDVSQNPRILIFLNFFSSLYFSRAIASVSTDFTPCNTPTMRLFLCSYSALFHSFSCAFPAKRAFALSMISCFIFISMSSSGVSSISSASSSAAAFSAPPPLESTVRVVFFVSAVVAVASLPPPFHWLPPSSPPPLRTLRAASSLFSRSFTTLPSDVIFTRTAIAFATVLNIVLGPRAPPRVCATALASFSLAARRARTLDPTSSSSSSSSSSSFASRADAFVEPPREFPSRNATDALEILRSAMGTSFARVPPLERRFRMLLATDARPRLASAFSFSFSSSSPAASTSASIPRFSSSSSSVVVRGAYVPAAIIASSSLREHPPGGGLNGGGGGGGGALASARALASASAGSPLASSVSFVLASRSARVRSDAATLRTGCVIHASSVGTYLVASRASSRAIPRSKRCAFGASRITLWNRASSATCGVFANGLARLSTVAMSDAVTSPSPSASNAACIASRR
eukprot:29438-Pelagococcus_subviridis.AAC.4